MTLDQNLDQSRKQALITPAASQSEDFHDDRDAIVASVVASVVASDVLVQADALPLSETDGKSSIAMHIVTESMQFKLDTVVDNSREAVALAAKLELALSILSLTETKLENALVMIGRLQEQLKIAEINANEC